MEKLDAKMLSHKAAYAACLPRGMSAREIVGGSARALRIEVSPDLISAVTDAVLEEVAA